MAKWKVARHGDSERFLRSLLGTTEQGCIEWPYCKSDKGYGLAVLEGVQRPANNQMCRLAYGEPKLIWKVAAHSCHNPGCVNPNHLRWATNRENSLDREANGTVNRGERNGKTNLTEADVLAIRAAPPFYGPLMERYGLTRHAISKIRAGKRWGHVKSPKGPRIGSHGVCRNGHAYDEANTRWNTSGYRGCRACDREAARRRRAKKNQERAA